MRLFALIVLCAFAVPAYAGERLSGSNVDVRSVVAFKVADAAVQKLVPSGWEISSPAAGPSKGFNVAVLLIDSISALDADGKPAAPTHGGVLVIPAKKKGTDATVPMIVFGIVLPDVAPGAYGVYVPGTAAIERTVRSAADGKQTANETWEFKADDGHAIRVEVQHERGASTKSKFESKVYSGAKPEFFRIYRQEQVSDIVRSTAIGIDRVSRVSIKASGPKLAPLFDGSEQLISVTSIPSYSRTVYLTD